MADVTAEKKTVSEERIEATGSIRLVEGATEVIIVLPESVPGGKVLAGTVSLRAVYAAAQGGE